MIELNFEDNYSRHLTLDDYIEYPEDKDSHKSVESMKFITKRAEEINLAVTRKSKSHDMTKLMPSCDGGPTSNLIEIISIAFGSGGIFLTYFEIVKPIIIEWLKNRNGRSIKIKSENKELEINGIKSLDEVLNFIKELDKLENQKLKKDSEQDNITS